MKFSESYEIEDEKSVEAQISAIEQITNNASILRNIKNSNYTNQSDSVNE